MSRQKFRHNHSTHSYPADKRLPAQFMGRGKKRDQWGYYISSQIHRQTMKKQHSRRARAYLRKQVELELQDGATPL